MGWRSGSPEQKACTKELQVESSSDKREHVTHTQADLIPEIQGWLNSNAQRPAGVRTSHAAQYWTEEGTSTLLLPDRTAFSPRQTASLPRPLISALGLLEFCSNPLHSSGRDFGSKVSIKWRGCPTLLVVRVIWNVSYTVTLCCSIEMMISISQNSRFCFQVFMDSWNRTKQNLCFL